MLSRGGLVSLSRNQFSGSPVSCTEGSFQGSLALANVREGQLGKSTINPEGICLLTILLR